MIFQNKMFLYQIHLHLLHFIRRHKIQNKPSLLFIQENISGIGTSIGRIEPKKEVNMKSMMQILNRIS